MEYLSKLCKAKQIQQVQLTINDQSDLEIPFGLHLEKIQTDFGDQFDYQHNFFNPMFQEVYKSLTICFKDLIKEFGACRLLVSNKGIFVQKLT